MTSLTSFSKHFQLFSFITYFCLAVFKDFRYFILFVLLIRFSFVSAQVPQEEKKLVRIAKEVWVGATLHSNGFGFNFNRSKFRSAAFLAANWMLYPPIANRCAIAMDILLLAPKISMLPVVTGPTSLTVKNKRSYCSYFCP
mgnify:CR=1 FL=1